MDNEIYEIAPDIPVADETQKADLNDTVSWVVRVIFRVGAGYLAKVILETLGF